MARDFIRTIIDEDLRSGRCSGVVTRFPPEPNGFPHIGHAKSITLNFGIAAEYGGTCHLRFDDTNPATEDIAYVRAIKAAVRWLGFEWGRHEYYASDYFEQLYEWACLLIHKGLAYVDDLSEAQIRALRGTVTRPGQPSTYRNRSVEENLALFAAMRAGEFSDGARVLRARIDMAHPNMKMRDPLMYRIRHAHHYRRKDAWCIYPFYDWAHGQSDAIEGVTHSICTLEFSPNRVLYDWYLEALGISPRPYQYEFARLNLGHTVTSKRKLLLLVRQGRVAGWDDPRMPTLAGLRRRGVTPAAIRAFCDAVGTTKVDSTHDPHLLDHHVRDDLNRTAPRVMCVLDPLPVTLTNYPAKKRELLDAPYWPRDINRAGTRKVPFSGSLLIERSDFSARPRKGFRRLSPGALVRLRYACIIRCDEVVKDAHGEVTELRCSWLADSDGSATARLRPRGTIHWVDAKASLPATVRLFERLFLKEVLGSNFVAELNPHSIKVFSDARIEPSVQRDAPDMRYQFTRLGYFWRDATSQEDHTLVFNQVAPLRDSWNRPTAAAKEETNVRKASTPGPDAPPPTLPPEERAWLAHHGLPDSSGRALLQTPGARAYFERALAHAPPVLLANWIANRLLPLTRDTGLDALPFGPKAFGQLVALVADQKATPHLGRDVLARMLLSGGDPAQLLATARAHTMEKTDALHVYIDALLEQFPDKVRAYRAGKKGLLGFFIGQIRQNTRGAAPPRLVRSLLTERLDQSTS